MRVDFEDGVAWVTLNRPDKRNAMNPALNREMNEVLSSSRRPALRRAGADRRGRRFSAGMDLKEYFRETEAKGHIAVRRAQRDAYGWWRRLRWFEKPTIAMVNGWCFGGAFSPLFACDLAIAAEEAQFGVSEINWGIIPGGGVTKVLVDLMSARDAMYYTLIGETFDGRKAAELKIVNEAVPRERLRARVREIADSLLAKNPATLKAAKDAIRRVTEMTVRGGRGLPRRPSGEPELPRQDEGRKEGIKQFIDDKTYRPGLGAYKKSS